MSIFFCKSIIRSNHHCLRQITQKFDEVMAVASSPRPSDGRKLYFDGDEGESNQARSLYDMDWVIRFLKDPYPRPHLTYPEALHIIVARFQSEPMSLKFEAMKKVLVLNLEVKELPRALQVKAEKVCLFVKILTV